MCVVLFRYSLTLTFRRCKAKNFLFTKIDDYIRDRIIIADQVIQELAGNKIKDGDVILTYAKSVLEPFVTDFKLMSSGPRSWRKFS